MSNSFNKHMEETGSRLAANFEANGDLLNVISDAYGPGCWNNERSPRHQLDQHYIAQLDLNGDIYSRTGDQKWQPAACRLVNERLARVRQSSAEGELSGDLSLDLNSHSQTRSHQADRQDCHSRGSQIDDLSVDAGVDVNVNAAVRERSISLDRGQAGCFGVQREIMDAKAMADWKIDLEADARPFDLFRTAS